MFRDNGDLILGAEAGAGEAAQLKRVLQSLGQRVHLVTSGEQILEIIRREIFEQAIVACELVIADQPALAYLARLPSLERLLATGPSGDVDMEIRARSAGADAYLPRPVSTVSLARALRAGSNEHRRGPPCWTLS